MMTCHQMKRFWKHVKIIPFPLTVSTLTLPSPLKFSVLGGMQWCFVVPLWSTANRAFVYYTTSIRLPESSNAVEYMLFDDWDKFNSSSLAEQVKQLADMEKEKIIHTFPSGSRTWVTASDEI